MFVNPGVMGTGNLGAIGTGMGGPTGMYPANPNMGQMYQRMLIQQLMGMDPMMKRPPPTAPGGSYPIR